MARSVVDADVVFEALLLCSHLLVLLLCSLLLVAMLMVVLSCTARQVFFICLSLTCGTTAHAFVHALICIEACECNNSTAVYTSDLLPLSWSVHASHVDLFRA